MREAFDESLINFIKKNLEKTLKEYQKNKDVEGCDDVSQALLLCNEILSTDYYARSEKVLDGFDFNNDLGKYPSLCKKWELLYKMDNSNKKSDLKKLFNMLVEHMEEWC